MLRAALILDGKKFDFPHDKPWNLSHIPEENPHILFKNEGDKMLVVTLDTGGTQLLQEFDATFGLMIPPSGSVEVSSSYQNGKMKHLALSGTITCRIWRISDWSTKTLKCYWMKKGFPNKNRPGETKKEWMLKFTNDTKELGCFEIMKDGKPMFSGTDGSNFVFRLARERYVLFNRALVGGKLAPINPEADTQEGAHAPSFSVRQAHLSDPLAPLILRMPSIPEVSKK